MWDVGCIDGACMTTERALFEQNDNLEQAVKACSQCPALQRCQQNMASIAMQIASPTPIVVAGETVQTHVARPVKEYLDPPELPYDGERGLHLLRQELIGEVVTASRPKRITRDALIGAYDAQDPCNMRESLGEWYEPGWDTLTGALRRYDYRIKATILTDHQKVFPIADCFFRDMLALGNMGFARSRLHRLAIRHSPNEYRQLFTKHQDNPDLTPTTIRCLATFSDIHYPDCAIEDYLLRVKLFANYYKEVPRFALKRICAEHNSMSAVKAVERWQETYESLQQQPYYRTFPDWLVAYAALSRAKGRKKYIARWYSFFGTRLESLDRGWNEKNTRSRHEQVTVNTYMDPETTVLQAEAVSETIGLLKKLSLLERKAVAYTYDLEIFADEDVDIQTLQTQLGTNNIEQYVEEHIIPKLRT